MWKLKIKSNSMNLETDVTLTLSISLSWNFYWTKHVQQCNTKWKRKQQNTLSHLISLKYTNYCASRTVVIFYKIILLSGHWECNRGPHRIFYQDRKLMLTSANARNIVTLPSNMKTRPLFFHVSTSPRIPLMHVYSSGAKLFRPDWTRNGSKC